MIGTILITYLAIYILLFSLSVYYKIDGFWMDKYFGDLGQNILIAIFFIPLAFTVLWRYNWGCESNYLNYEQ